MLEENDILRYLRKENIIQEFYIQEKELSCTKSTGNYYQHAQTQGILFLWVLLEGFGR